MSRSFLPADALRPQWYAEYLVTTAQVSIVEVANDSGAYWMRTRGASLSGWSRVADHTRLMCWEAAHEAPEAVAGPERTRIAPQTT